tara:strand:- start:13 stop:423 length:411 start_codon:yes stop_codon:yes gene_type:complete
MKRSLKKTILTSPVTKVAALVAALLILSVSFMEKPIQQDKQARQGELSEAALDPEELAEIQELSNEVMASLKPKPQAGALEEVEALKRDLENRVADASQREEVNDQDSSSEALENQKKIQRRVEKLQARINRLRSK